jgi:hypothetical protein
MAKPKTPPEPRFMAKIDRGQYPGDCWRWRAALNAGGYALFGLDGRMRLGYRIAYEWWVGLVPDGLQLDHICRVRQCVNPDHLEPVTRQENALRGVRARAVPKPTHCPYGHEYSGKNLWKTREGYLHCVICRNRRGAEFRARRKARRESAPN